MTSSNLVEGAIRLFGGNGVQTYDSSTASNEQIVNQNKYDISAQWTEETAALTGSIKIQISTDRINWYDLPDSECVISGAGSSNWEVNECSYYYARLYVTIDSGEISISAIINCKRI